MKAKATAEQFVKTWEEHRNVEKVAEELSITKSNVYLRRKKYIKLGVKLSKPKHVPHKNRGRIHVDVGALNALITSLQ